MKWNKVFVNLKFNYALWCSGTAKIRWVLVRYPREGINNYNFFGRKGIHNLVNNLENVIFCQLLVKLYYIHINSYIIISKLYIFNDYSYFLWKMTWNSDSRICLVPIYCAIRDSWRSPLVDSQFSSQFRYTSPLNPFF